MRAFKLALRRAEKHLTVVDRKMARVIESHGRCSLVPYWDRSPYESLVRAVAHQQLHANAANAILGRLIAWFPKRSFPTPEDLVASRVEDLRPLGFSLAKVTTIQGIAAGALSGVVPSRAAAETMTDEELIEQLCALRGIGRWTVEMLLIFTLGRLDVMPVDDFGIKAGLQAVFRLSEPPKKTDILRLTDRWQSYRSIGAWYLWREADRRKQLTVKKKPVAT